MKILAGMFCLLLINLSASCQEKATDSVELHVDGKIFITLSKEQINTSLLSIPLQRGQHKISWVPKPSQQISLIPHGKTLPETEMAVVVFFTDNRIRIKNYSEL